MGLQRLRCRCNFHALRFVPKLQNMGKLIVERMRDKHPRWGPNDDEFHADDNRHFAGINSFIILQLESINQLVFVKDVNVIFSNAHPC